MVSSYCNSFCLYWLYRRYRALLASLVAIAGCFVGEKWANVDKRVKIACY